ncbi:helix-turn-helix domain-containing protein [Actinocorallia aurantiaca]|uniref:Helix-turn-helix domain-containing protein n=1 Tax=Actinocorallia aurantiaca TaxID=46204 RepID=A0ABN3U9F6_9ACTN
MKELAGRLTALDPDAGAAVRVIAYFDRLAEGRAGLEAVVRGAVILAGCPARLADPERRVLVRVLTDGCRDDVCEAPDPAWPSVSLTPGGAGRLWLERPGPAGTVGAMVLERAAATARAVLERTRGRAPVGSPGDDPALVELLLDPAVPEAERLHAARRLGLPRLVRAVAVAGGPPVIEPAETEPGHHDGRAGIGPDVPVLGLPDSWKAAAVALRLAAEGDASDPGPRVVRFTELGGLAVLASAVGPETEPVPDVRALDRAAAEAPWAAATLHAVASSPSLRAAASALVLHHSTLQDRLARAERLLGWSVRTQEGRLRLHLAFALRRLHRRPR